MPKLKIDLVVDDKGSIVLEGFGRKVDSVAWSGKTSIKQLGSELAIAGAGLTALSVAFGAAMKKFVDAANVQEQAEVKLGAVLRATGNAAGYNLEQLKEMASGFQDITTSGDEATLSAMAMLASFREIKGDQFKEATAAALDMSAVMGRDLKSSVLQIGKALNDPIRGMTALNRAGVAFTDQQRKTIKSLQESGDILGAQKIILQELKSEFGGTAEALRNTFGGAVTGAKNAFGDLLEEIGFTVTKNETLKGEVGLLEQKFKDLTRTVSEHKDEIGDIWISMVGAGETAASTVATVSGALYKVYEGAQKIHDLGGPSVGEWGIIGYALFRGGPQAAALTAAFLAAYNAGKKLSDLADKLRGITPPDEYEIVGAVMSEEDINNLIKAKGLEEEFGLVAAQSAEGVAEAHQMIGVAIEGTNEKLIKQSTTQKQILSDFDAATKKKLSIEEEMYKEAGIGADAHYKKEAAALVKKAAEWEKYGADTIKIEEWLYNKIGELSEKAMQEGQTTASIQLDKMQASGGALIDEFAQVEADAMARLQGVATEIKGLDGSNIAITASFDGSLVAAGIDDLVNRLSALSTVSTGLQAQQLVSGGTPVAGGSTNNNTTTTNVYVNQSQSRSDIVNTINEINRSEARG
jgi:hypothetical protein